MWGIFGVFVLLMLFLDLGVFHRRAHEIRTKEAVIWSLVWVVFSGLATVGIWFFYGQEKGLQFLTAWIIEKSLSVDNLFVFVAVFSYFSVPKILRHKVLFWGVIGALVMRAVFIMLGTVLIERFDWMMYVFGAFLVITGLKMAVAKEDDIHPEANPALKLFRRLIPGTKDFRQDHFFVREGGRWLATPLFFVLVVIEASDVMFAVDSVPAVLAVSLDPFIVYASNIFAILGLRALFFVLAGLLERFTLLKYGLAVILSFVGVKMIIAEWYHFPVWLSLSIILGVLTVTFTASMLVNRRQV